MILKGFANVSKTQIRKLAILSGGMVLAASLVSCAGAGTSDDVALEAPSSAANAEAYDLLPEEIKERGYLSIASAFDYPPFASMTESGEMIGVDYELGNEIAERLGVNAEWERLGSFGAIIPAVQSGRFDMAMDGIAALEERLPIVSFVEYFEASYLVQVHAGNPENINPDDLCGVRVASTTGSYESQILQMIADDCVENGKDPLEPVLFGDAATQDTAFASKQVPATLGDAIWLQAKSDANPGTLELLTPSAPVWPSQASGIVLQKDLPELGLAIEMVLNDMQDDGTYQEIMTSNGLPESVFLIPATFREEK